MVGIVILTYNTWEETAECLESIVANGLQKNNRVYVVDNASSVKINQKCKSYIQNEGFILLSSPRNLGYSAGNNIGITRALIDGCDFVLIANNDVVFCSNIIPVMLSFFAGNKNVGAVAPKVLLPTGMTQETNLGCKMTMAGKYKYILRKTPLSFLVNDFCSRFRVDADASNEPIKIFSPHGCCFMISSKCIEHIGLFDENVFLFEEENILGCKLEKFGYSTFLLPNVFVVHKHAMTTGKNRALSYIYMIDSELYYCKNYLRASNIQCFGLLMIRLVKYLYISIYDRNYRKYFALLIKRIMKRWHT